jgi:hypothetical protein
MTRSPYHEALIKNRAELVTLQRGMQQLIDMREKEISAAAGEIAMLRKSKAAHGELIAQIDLELNQKDKVA